MDNDDILLWADGTWCYASILEEYLTFMSDDFERIPHGTPRYQQIELDF